MFIKGSYIKYCNIVSYIAPYIVQQPIGGIIGIGDSFTFKIKAGGTNITYKWYKNQSLIAGANSDTFSITNATANDEEYYYCVISNNTKSIRSDKVFLTVGGAVYIVTQPDSITTNIDTTVVFKISAIGSDPINYKWYKNNILIPSATADTIYINKVQVSDEANYYCIAKNSLNSRTSNTVQLKLYKQIVVVTNPTDATYNAGQVLNTYLSCIGALPITAQWRKDGIYYKPLITTNTGKVELYILLNANDDGKYDCVLTNSFGTVTSPPFYITVNKNLTFTTQPVSGTVDVEKSFTFTAEADGTDPISYKWIKANPFIDLGITGKILTLNNIEITDQANYACVATNTVGSVTSLSVPLSVNSNYMITRNEEYALLDTNTYWQLN